jgi:hypothetical protein
MAFGVTENLEGQVPHLMGKLLSPVDRAAFCLRTLILGCEWGG